MCDAARDEELEVLERVLGRRYAKDIPCVEGLYPDTTGKALASRRHRTKMDFEEKGIARKYQPVRPKKCDTHGQAPRYERVRAPSCCIAGATSFTVAIVHLVLQC